METTLQNLPTASFRKEKQKKICGSYVEIFVIE